MLLVGLVARACDPETLQSKGDPCFSRDARVLGNRSAAACQKPTTNCLHLVPLVLSHFFFLSLFPPTSRYTWWWSWLPFWQHVDHVFRTLLRPTPAGILRLSLTSYAFSWLTSTHSFILYIFPPTHSDPSSCCSSSRLSLPIVSPRSDCLFIQRWVARNIPKFSSAFLLFQSSGYKVLDVFFLVNGRPECAFDSKKRARYAQRRLLL